MMRGLFRQNPYLWAGMLIALLQIQQPALSSVIIPPEELGRRVIAYATESISATDPEASPEVEIVRLPSSPIVLQGDNVQFMLENSGTLPFTSRAIVRVTMSTEAETRTLGIPVRLFENRTVWVATRFIRAKEPITPSDAALQQRRMEYGAASALGPKENSTDYASRINITPGSILEPKKLRLIPAICRNDEIRMILAMKSGVNVTVQGKAMEDGVVGKRIRVSQRTGNNKTKTYIGEVISRNTVLIRI